MSRGTRGVRGRYIYNPDKMPDIPRLRAERMHSKRQNRLGVQTIRKSTENQWQQSRWGRKKPGNSDGEKTSVELVTRGSSVSGPIQRDNHLAVSLFPLLTASRTS